MANTDAPMGGVPIRHKNGAPYNGAVTPYYLAGDYAVAMYRGDAVLVTGLSNDTEYLGNGPGTLPEVEKATAAGSTYLTGFIVNFNPLASDLDKTYNPASTERIVYVADDPDLVFEMQEDGDTTPLTYAACGSNADMIFTHSGSTTTGRSGMEIDSTTVASTATLKLRILGLVNKVGNDIGAHANWEFMINLHSQRCTTGYATT